MPMGTRRSSACGAVRQKHMPQCQSRPPLSFAGVGSSVGRKRPGRYQSRLSKPINGMTYCVQSMSITMHASICNMPNLKDSQLEYWFVR